MAHLANINWIGVLLAFVVYFLLGALWFTLLFSKLYKISLGRDREILENKPIFIVGPAICTLVITVASAVFMKALHIQSIAAALQFSALVGLGYLVANTVNRAINPNIPRPLLYGAISGAYHLLGITMVSVILVIMQ